MTTPIRIDFVSDVVCPWCAIGMHSLLRALEMLRDEVSVDLHIRAFELNPAMVPEGEDLAAHLAGKYGAGPEQFARTHDMLKARGEELGFVFDLSKRSRIYNTFDAHRLLHAAGLAGKQLPLKLALLAAYFTEGQNISDHAVLLDVADSVGLDRASMQEVLASDAHAEAVRQEEAFFQQAGISAVPSVIVNERHLIQGGQPVEAYVNALRQIVAAG
ncbi:DsbA family oxidoreductase [Burkholderiaceae bacterium DAT-1]|nr:DsbA family oxidoreductase [Burkholderiaceae bacterium DAT-1]